MRNKQFHVESLDYWSSWWLEFPNLRLIYKLFLAPLISRQQTTTKRKKKINSSKHFQI